jgi:hypothetical protein
VLFLSCIQDLWVVKEDSGILLFNRDQGAEISPHIFGSFMGALNSFAKKLNEEGISEFELGKKKYIIKTLKGILFIGNANKKTKHDKFKKELNKVINLFIEKYACKILKNWFGNVEIFKDFNQDLDGITQDPLKDFWKCLT